MGDAHRQLRAPEVAAFVRLGEAFLAGIGNRYA